MRTPQSPSVDVHAVAKGLVEKLGKRAPNKAHPLPGTKSVPKLKNDQGSASGTDKINSLTHMMDSIDFNMNHGYNHVLEAKVHTEKAIDHIKKNPELAVSYNTLFDRISKVHKNLKKVMK